MRPPTQEDKSGKIQATVQNPLIENLIILGSFLYNIWNWNYCRHYAKQLVHVFKMPVYVLRMCL